MFGAIKKIFGKASTSAAPEAKTAQISSLNEGKQAAAAAAQESIKREPRKTPAIASASDTEVTLYLGSIVERFPKELQGAYSPQSIADLTFSLAKEKVLPQLAHGSVKITFGELRRSCPTGVFTNKSSEDGVLIELPLEEILAQIKPHSFNRRQGQKRVEVPDEITEVFNANDGALSAVRVLNKEEVRAANSDAKTATAVASPVASGVAPAQISGRPQPFTAAPIPV